MTYEKVCSFMSNALTKMCYKKHVVNVNGDCVYFYLGTQHKPAFVFSITEQDMGFIYTSYGIKHTKQNYSFEEIKKLYEKAKEFLECYKQSAIKEKLEDLNKDFVC